MLKAPPLFYIATCYRFYRQLPVPRFQQRQKQLHQLWRENPRRHPENFLQSRVCSTRPGVQSRRAVHVRQSIIFLIANYGFFWINYLQNTSLIFTYNTIFYPYAWIETEQ